MTPLLQSVERGILRGFVIMATSVAAVWVIDRVFGGRS